MDILIQGDLYIKKNREFYKTFNLTPEIVSQLDGYNINDIIDYAMNFGESNKIYQLVITETGPKLRFRFENGTLSPFTPITFDELENNYVRLLDFLEKSKYVGMQSKISTNYRNTNEEDYRILLYDGDSIIITYDSSKSDYLFNKKIPLQIYDKNFVKKIQVSGGKMDLFSEPRQLYSELFSEILNETRTMKRKKAEDQDNNEHKKN